MFVYCIIDFGSKAHTSVPAVQKNARGEAAGIKKKDLGARLGPDTVVTLVYEEHGSILEPESYLPCQGAGPDLG
jgi:hypothetical protein